jgi:hypothetical protein
LVMVPSGAVLLGWMYNIHLQSGHIPSLTARIMSRAIQFPHAILLVGPSFSAIPLTESLV